MSTRSKPQPTFKRILIVRLLGLTLLATLAISVFGARYLAHQLEQDAAEHLRESAFRIRDGLQSFLTMHQSALGILSEQLRPQSGQPIPVELAGRLLEHSIAHYSGFLTMLVTDRDGRILRAARRDQHSFTPAGTQNQWVSDRPYFLSPKATSRPFLSGIFQGRGLGNDPIVAISHPVLNSRSEFVGVVEASIDITRIPLTAQHLHRAMTVIAYDATSKIVYSNRPDHLHPLEEIGFKIRSSLSATGEMSRLEDSRLTDRGGNMVAHYALRLPVGDSGWEVLAATSVEEIDQDVRNFYWLAAVTLLLLSLLAWQVARMIARSISEPVVSLVGDMQRFTPESEAPVAARSNFVALELAQIHAEFVRMGSRMRESFLNLRKALSERDSTNKALNELLQSLDQIVADRTTQLAESEARYRKVVESSGDMIYRTNAEGKIEFHNSAFEKLLGIQAVGQRMADLIDQPSRTAIMAQIRNQIRHRTPSIYLEFKIRKSNGESRWLGQSTQLLLNEANVPSGFQAIARDITEQKAAEQALRVAEERYALAVRGSNNGIWDWDLRNQTIYYSTRWRQMFGLSEDLPLESIEDWLGRVHPADATGLRGALNLYSRTNNEELFEREHRIRHEDGTWRWVLTCGAAIRSATGAALRIAGSTTDITAGKLEDPLTGLPNRLAIVERLEQLVARHEESPQRKFALLFLDLDRFKMINDSLGHIVGDELLFGVSRRIIASVASVSRGKSTVGRLGGDEFVVVVEYDDLDCLPVQVAEAILAQAVAPHLLQGSRVFVSMSIGIAHCGDNRTTAEELLRNADTAMYQAKTEGRGRYCLFDSTMHARAVARLELESDLRRALEAREFILHYQPQVNLRTGQLSGFEALVRWMHPKRGMVPPIQFISAAEENGLILPLGRWVLEEGVRQLAAWDKIYKPSIPLALSINLSPMQFADPELRSIVESILNSSGVAPSRLHLEITESMVANDPKVAQTLLRDLSGMGIGLEIDDFGTGYSCLSQLHQLPFDTLKIDRSFVLAMDQADSGQQGGGKIVESIVNLSSSLNIHVIAEGIETEDHWIKLARLGCEYGQGYYFSKPLPADAALDLMRFRSHTPWQPPQQVSSLLPSLNQLQANLVIESAPLPNPK